MSRRTPWGRQKPPPWAQLDPDSPKAKGLVFAGLCTEGSGGPVDLVGRLPLTLKGAASWDVGAGSAVRRLVTSAAGAGADAVVPPPFKLQPPITIVWKGTRLGTPTNSSGLFGVCHNTGNSAPFLSYSVNVDPGTATSIRLEFNNAGSFANGATVAGLSNGPIWFAATFAPGSQALYLNDPRTPAGTGSNALTSITYGATASVYFGNFPGVSRNPNVAHEYGLIYGRLLSAAELEALYFEGPYDLALAPPTRRYPVPAGGGPGPAPQCPAALLMCC